MPGKYFVTCIGNAVIDILALVKDSVLEENAFKKGSMTLIDQNDVAKLANIKYSKVAPGGSVANTIVTMANFGVRNSFIGNVGSGIYGDLFCEDLSSNQVDFHCKNKTGYGSTARSFILITPDNQRTMCTYLGEASNIAKEIDDSAIANSDILYIEGYLWDGSENIKALKKAMLAAKKNNTKIAFTLSDTFCVRKHKKDMLKLAGIVDILFANDDEIKELISSDVIDASSLRKIAKNNENLTLVITRSEKSAIIFESKEQKFYKVPALKVENIVDTTGAGDAFAAGFLYGLYRKLSTPESANIGHLFAANIIQKIGARFEGEEIEKIKKLLIQLESSENVAARKVS